MQACEIRLVNAALQHPNTHAAAYIKESFRVALCMNVIYSCLGRPEMEQCGNLQKKMASMIAVPKPPTGVSYMVSTHYKTEDDHLKIDLKSCSSYCIMPIHLLVIEI